MAMTLAEEIPHKNYFADENNVLSFFFCEATSERQREATSILRGLIYQIVTQHPPFLKRVLSKYDVRREALFASFDSLWAVLMDIGQATTGPEIYCIIDALDECEPESQEMLFHQIYHSFSKTGTTGSDPSRLHFLIISRPYPELKSCLSTFTCVDLGSFEEIKRDLKAMIKDTVKDLARRNNYTEPVAQRVCRILEEKADGTFLWVGIAHNELRLVQSRKVVEKLQALPRGLYSLYRNLLDAAAISATACGPDDYPLIKKILEIVAFALRPLTIAEIAEACRLHFDTDSSSRLQFTREIIDLCHLLVVVDNGHVRMLHRSVQEFLMMEMQEISPTGSNYALTYRCIEVILQHCWPEIDASTLKPSHGFLAYSVLHWPEHASLARTDFNVPKEHEAFFQDRLGTWKWWLESYNHLEQGSGADLDTGLSAIHVAARWGIIPLISFFLQNGLEVKDAKGQTPLLIAAQYSKFEAISLLVESGACVRALNNDHQNVLHIICKNGHGNGWQMADFLLNSGVSPYDCDKDNMTPFLYAVGNLDEELARVFLQNGFDLTTGIRRLSWPGRTTVSSITHRRSKDQREGAGADLETDLTALHFSSLNACTKMTAFLLRHGADPNIQSGTGDTPLHFAIRRRLLGRIYDDVWQNGDYAIESSIDSLTDYESEEASDIYQTIDKARIHIVDTLLESKTIDVNIANTCGDYPQHVIDFYKDYAISILCKLIEKGADCSRMNGCRQTCLHLASKQGNLRVVRKLVEEGHDILLEDSNGLSPFHYALRHGRLNVLQFLSTACESTLSKLWHSIDHHGRNPLHHHVSSLFCHVDTVDFLIQLGCDVNQPDAKGNSSLGLYVGSFHLGVRRDIFFLLMDKGADPLWVNGRGENFAHLLMHHRGADTEILECLFRCRLDPAARDIDGRTFMHHGAIHGAFTKELIEFLQWRDVLDMHSRDSVGKTPLNYAEEKAHEEDLEGVLFDPKWDDSFDTLNEVARTLL
jgi:ankyrin repeat protein